MGEATQPVHLLAVVDQLNERLVRDVRVRLEASGLRLRGSEGRILNLIPPGGTRPTTLAAGAWITKQAMGKRIRALEQRGLVRVSTDPDDGRAVLVHLTSAGARVRELILGHIADLEGALAAQVGGDRYRTFRAVLDELAGNQSD